MGIFPKWVGELDIGEYFSNVGKSLEKITKGAGEAVGGAVGGVLGGIFKKLWFWILLALIGFILFLVYKTGAYKRVLHE